MEQAKGEVREGKIARREIVPISGERVVLLRSEEERMLAGGEGPATKKAMQLLVALGEVLGADRLIPIVSAQIAGVSYGNIGDAGMELLEDWAGQGGRVRVRSTLNPAGMDLERWREMGVDEEYHDRQLRIIKAFERMGVEITCTCTPYLVGNLPKLGDHIAWSESSAVCYANSVLGARTNREGGPSALAAALTGKTPRYGLHLDEGRRPTVVVEVKARLATTYDYSLLGYSVGRIIGSGIPYFNGVTGAEPDGLKIMSAALAASGGIAMFHIKGVTPEAEGQSTDGLERLCIDYKELETSREKLAADGDPDLACIGCPHASLEEMRDLARTIRGRRVIKGKGLWIWTSKGVYELARRRGYLGTIEKAGGRVFTDTCMVVCPLERSGFRHMVSNSCKACHYVPSTAGLRASVADMHTALSKVLEDS
jgi:predicted aconitase